ncbi:MAG: lamin tail domain-containing protein [Candidatus Nealsonbacteria bacterium]|nr:lamin tail domain-containing protein [Candidatus Nealsonbacteria bacterium]
MVRSAVLFLAAAVFLADAGPVDAGGVVINEVLAHTDWPMSDGIELHNVTGAAINVGGWYLSNSEGGDNYKKFQIPDPTTIPLGGYWVFDEVDFNPTPMNPQPHHFSLDGDRGGGVWLMEADGAGNLTQLADHVEFGAQANGKPWGRWPNGVGTMYPMTDLTLRLDNSGPRLGDVIVNEVHYNPGVMPGAEELEFVEIYNTTDAPVNLTNWRLRKGIDYDFTPGDTLEALGTMVVVGFDPAGEPAKLAAFKAAHGIVRSIMAVGPYAGELDNDGESVQLQYPGVPPYNELDFYPGLLEDEVIYDDDNGWPVTADGQGFSLNRASADSFGNNAASWTAAVPTPGVVPEPSALVLLGMGTVGLAAFAWRRGRNVGSAALLRQRRG